MKLYYYKSTDGNFGDDMNEWLWERLVPGIFAREDDTVFCGIGTVLNDSIPDLPKKKVVFGSGAGYDPLPKDFGAGNWEFICVRGPLTASVLNLSTEKAVTDGAILLSSLPEFSPLQTVERDGIAFIPHYQNALMYGQWEKICRKIGIDFINPRDDSANVIQKIRKARLIITEAMHGAIVADTMRVPWIPVSISSNINSFKWLDWTLSLNLDYSPVVLPHSTYWEMWQDFKLRLLSQGYNLRGVSADEAINFQRQLSRKNDRYKKTWLKQSIEYATRAIGKIVYLPIICKFISVFDLIPGYKAKKALDDVSKNGHAYLSQDLIYQSRLIEMQKRLQKIRETINT